LNVGAATPASIYVEHLDLNRFSGAVYEQGLQAYFSAKYRDRPIGVVIVVGSAALEYVLRARAGLWPAVPVVFTFVDEPTVARLKLPPDVTGYTVLSHPHNMIVAARAVVPGLERIVLVGDPPERQTNYRNLRREIPASAPDLELVDLTGLPMTALRKRVAVLPDRSAILYTSIYSDGEGHSYIPADSLAIVAEVANRPIVIDIDSLLGRGAVGGFLITGSSIGEQAARVALRILNGERAANIPVEKSERSTPIFDWRQLRRWGVDQAELPSGSEIRFRDPTAWQQYRWQILLIGAALLLQTVLIVRLFREHRRRRTAEIAALGAMHELAHLDRVATAGELSAAIAHEVNQPLAAIVANANAGLRFLAKVTPNLDEARAALKRIVGDGHRAAEVVGSVRALFKKDSEEKVPLDLNRLIQDVLGHLRGELQKQGIVVKLGLNGSLPFVLGHSGELQQVVFNLVKNAADAMRSVSDRPRVLNVKSSIDGADGVLVSIEDSGTGIAAKDVGRIFESFFTTKSQGMGMGLSICRSIIEAHHGRLWASPAIGHGAVFNIRLPAVAPGAE
jgi:signal transduction histidine kinase